MISEYTPPLSDMDYDFSDEVVKERRTTKRRTKRNNYFAGSESDQESNDIPSNDFNLFERRGSSRIRGHMPTDSLAFSRNSRVNGNMPSTSFSVDQSPKAGFYDGNYIIELPQNAKEGEIIQIHGSEVGVNAELVAIKVPPSEFLVKFGGGEASSNAAKKRYVKIAPQVSQNEFQSSTCNPTCPSISYSPARSRRLNHRTPRQKAMDKERSLSETSSKVGPQHQVSFLPDPREFNTSPPSNKLYHQIWNPSKLDQVAMSQHAKNNIHNVLDNLPSNHKEIFMEALHCCEYDLGQGWPLYLQRIRELKIRGDLPGEQLPSMVAKTFHKAIWEKRKDLKLASAVVWEKGHKLNTASLLVNYYNTYKITSEYSKLKDITKDESDVCMVCNDGGTLIVCDGCGGAYHKECIDPPLEEIPEGMWHCPQCTSGDDKSIPAYEVKRGGGKEPNSDHNDEWTYWGINYA